MRRGREVTLSNMAEKVLHSIQLFSPPRQEVSDPVVAATGLTNVVLQPHQCCACPVFQDKNPARFSSLSSVTHEVMS